MVVIPARSIQSWQPANWAEIIGNSELKEALRDLVASVRLDWKLEPFRLMAYGHSRGGKTSTIQYAIKCLLCLNLNLESLDACHDCEHCKRNVELYGTTGWTDLVNVIDEDGTPKCFQFNYVRVDCTRLTEAELENILLDLRYDSDTLRIVYLDEFHRLFRRSMDERLLVAMDTYNAVWLASSAVVGELDPMLKNRFDYPIKVQRPTMKELTLFLAHRCEESGIQCEEPQATLTRLAELSHQIPGLALRVLRRAYSSRSKLLTRKLVEDHFLTVKDLA